MRARGILLTLCGFVLACGFSASAWASYVWVSGSGGGNGLVTRSLSCVEVGEELVKGVAASAGAGAVAVVGSCSGVVTAVGHEYVLGVVLFNPPGSMPSFLTMYEQLGTVMSEVDGVGPDWDNIGPLIAAIAALWALAWLVRQAMLTNKDIVA